MNRRQFLQRTASLLTKMFARARELRGDAAVIGGGRAPAPADPRNLDRLLQGGTSMPNPVSDRERQGGFPYRTS